MEDNLATQIANTKHEDIEVFFELPYPPFSGNNQYDHGLRGSKTLKPEAFGYRSQVHGILYAMGLAQLQLEGPLWVEWQIHPPTDVRRDTDNFRKPVADAITKAGVWADDSNKILVTEVFHWKATVPGGRVLVWVRGLPDELNPYAQTDGKAPRTLIAHRKRKQPVKTDVQDTLSTQAPSAVMDGEAPWA